MLIQGILATCPAHIKELQKQNRLEELKKAKTLIAPKYYMNGRYKGYLKGKDDSALRKRKAKEDLGGDIIQKIFKPAS